MNFRKLEKLKVPDELMEKLLAIPETEEEKAPAVIPWWRNRAVIAAVSLVLVSALSLIVYFLIGNKINVPIAVKPSPSATEIVWSTDENGETVATEVIIVPDGNNDQDGMTPTEPKSVIAQIIESIFGTRDTTDPTTAPDTDRGRTSPTTKTSPTDGKTDPTQSADTPTQGHEPAKPTQPPTEEPEPIEPTEPYDDPPEPTVPMEPPGPEDPTEPPDDPPNPTESPYKDVISDLVYIGEIPDGSVIYCWLYYNNWRMYNDDAYTAMFYADVTPLGDGYAFLDYMPKAHGVDLPVAGHYQYVWYLSYDGSHNGRRLSSGDVYLNN